MPYAQQVAQKDSALRQLLAPFSPQQWLEPIQSPTTGFRNKAKMVVHGAAHAPCLGAAAMDANGQPLSLTHCALYSESMQTVLAQLEAWIRKAGIPPYNLAKKKGELKFVLLSENLAGGTMMLRLVLRSEDAIARIERALPLLKEMCPAIAVVTANIQPVHMARLEGEKEIYLTEQTHLLEYFNDVPLVVRPKSFFQTNGVVAEQLYATAREWVRAINPSDMWDLFCGVGGFALHCASETTKVTGIEIEPEAIASAKRSAQMMGLEGLSFAALDSTGFSMQHDSAPELVLVNPPRRGLGAPLCQQLSHFAPQHIIYSSCNPQTLAEDLSRLDGYVVTKVQWFDMFPHTEHAEVMVLLTHQPQ
ncbi:23S rRNA (uracil(747)-C(5))-methyltransferase RlmC [Vibrio stylophorae]|uniref:23S rRNA (uracil(747)-C(5))-methyltransferase RlmC n=2 Tax=Vibrio stylophorae TaxID=659351 RepID=A0ABM8ZXJ3_9VIBR|nr:23S rRNA (uracil(747)-C(5))-methyltransferase RlmC [Vibrio stylophorae]